MHGAFNIKVAYLHHDQEYKKKEYGKINLSVHKVIYCNIKEQRQRDNHIKALPLIAVGYIHICVITFLNIPVNPDGYGQD